MAKEHPRYANADFPDYEYVEYPKMIYPGADDPRKPYDAKGRPLQGIIVQNEAEEREAMGLEAPEAEAPAARTPRAVETGSPGTKRMLTPADEKAELLEQANTLGVKVDKSWSLARIQDAIDTHQAERDVV